MLCCVTFGNVTRSYRQHECNRRLIKSEEDRNGWYWKKKVYSEVPPSYQYLVPGTWWFAWYLLLCVLKREADLSKAEHRTAGQGTALHGTARHLTTPHGTARHRRALRCILMKCRWVERSWGHLLFFECVIGTNISILLDDASSNYTWFIVQNVSTVITRSTAQHDKAPHSTASHGRARHGTALHRTWLLCWVFAVVRWYIITS